jgi:hypothetical protein
MIKEIKISDLVNYDEVEVDEIDNNVEKMTFDLILKLCHLYAMKKD